MRVLMVNGSYRENGATDHYVKAMERVLTARGVEVDVLLLRDVDLGFCTNCRACMQQPGDKPGVCVLHDAMDAILARIEASDAVVLASSTNAGSVTALFRRWIERLVVYGYWPWGMAAPKLRKAGKPKKKALLLATCGAPGILGRLAFSTLRQMASTAKMLGAKPCGTLFSGFHAQHEQATLTARQIQRAERLVEKLF